MKNRFILLAKVTLVLVYLVAGAVVRMTGSGMGCPDWPKCFGYYIPPSDIKQLTWAPHREFRSGQVIIKDERLLVAQSDFTTSDAFDTGQWRPYTKHDYAIFNPAHTWVEYINRLFGALAGFAVFGMALASWRFRKTKTRITVLSWLSVILMGTQAWLGAKVVYSVLNPIKITLHMAVALLIVAVLLYIIREARENSGRESVADRPLGKLLWTTMAAVAIQIILGTQVREFVDEQVSIVGEGRMDLVLSHPAWEFFVHRSFSIAVLILVVLLAVRHQKMTPGFSNLNWVAALTLVEIATGVVMYVLGFPFGTQALHLILATVIFGLLFYTLLQNQARKPV